ncbi:MAG: hypothetical protein GY751_12695 [Bacteroidetes bacterium]|nr:hypothetical protein [Bacteroidota bacterium]
MEIKFPGGHLRETDGGSEGLGYACYFWSSSSISGISAWSFKITNLFGDIYKPGVSKTAGYSVRCVKD